MLDVEEQRGVNVLIKAKFRWVLGSVLVLLLVALGAGTHTVWPFFAYPVTELSFVNAAPKVPLDVPHMMAGVAERVIISPIVRSLIPF